MADEHRLAYKWVEQLPAGCPPGDAQVPNGEAYYRLVASVPPTQLDFHSQRRLYPNKWFRMPECVTRACSLFGTRERAVEILLLPTHKDKGEVIVKLILPPESGLVKETGDKDHFSWWWAQGFDPVMHCEQV